MPKISIIVPCYNQAQYLDECLLSVLEQSYTDWECIVVDDGSPDNTEETAQKWIEKDSRFKYLKKENGGVSSARNFGIENANGEWILPLDGDDKIGNQYLELASNNFHNADLIYCDGQFFGSSTENMNLPEFNPFLILFENQIFCTTFFKKNDWKLIGGFDETMHLGYEDWDFWLSFISLKRLFKSFNK
ncbi:glycosyltransferase family 2 protein [Chryseobacterium sp. Y16C]|uniref:glycosyltransferase family 2 protein n=1 Tax=Chryseobacterium sp. Y16C TaxID=2920939 RepID=UPI001F0A8948|nr:glycosyltransferase family A protein [Chryseobacterium sp. Y16C]UMQ40262.1 glycosyltransferase family 2 protein [Chryseobacterium sp. Y16C]